MRHYSVPYEYVKYKVDVRITKAAVEIFYNGNRIAAERFLSWAESIGENTTARDAGFNYPGACAEDIEYHSDRKLDKTLITKLSTCTYIQEAHNIIILGASGAGKTYMACAFGIAACRNFYKVKYVRLPDLLNDLAVARGEGIYQKVMKQYKKVNPLLDEWLLNITPKLCTRHGAVEPPSRWWLSRCHGA